jgi:hypothetical protein
MMLIMLTYLLYILWVTTMVGDESETSTAQELRQKNVGSGDYNNNCAANAHEASAHVECFNEEE